MWYVTCCMTKVHVVCDVRMTDMHVVFDVLYDGHACAVWRAV